MSPELGHTTSIRPDPLRIEQLAVSALTPWARNARTHSKKQLKQLAQSIETFGWTNPVLVDGTGTILAGHGRVAAAKLLGLTSVPCVRLEHMTPAQKRAYVLADNKLALNAGWDDQLLGEELAHLMGLSSEELGFDLSVTGFSIAEVDGLVEGLTPEEPGDPADDLVPERAPRRARPGDVWQLGAHRLICGDALHPAVVALLMEGEQARMVFSDPPYNVRIDGHVLTRSKGGGASGAPRHPEFVMASGEMSRPEFTAFLTTAFQNMAHHAVDGSIHFLCMDWRHMAEMLEAGQAVYAELKNLIVWAKDNGGMGSFYRSRHELVFAFKKGTAPHVNSFELGQHGRYRTNVWEYRGVNTRRAGRLEELALHPTCKPVQMIADAIKDVSARGEIVLDLFGGSGSTLIAAEKTGRRARLAELDPVYCDRILARWEAQARDEAELVVCGWAAPSGARAGDVAAAGPALSVGRVEAAQ
ncbi:DNA modification methylase [Rubellimicrobium mesophilum DSM 19309]|uniref:site-specific DNA-methyltransferase (adenine-specific) n=1 Tax=Rubellimicrobium mesophilum DSM 19309 TaxID=442562 RepID=A0A017HJ19_9RHOB|nr:DNA methyltransferase [Rubellimicrobium mesophilum]EYD74330.1 DNA modification methylase [Rubellimicrobium mesophilum DSM 19309]